jgi:hypothetical protein
MCFNCYSTRSGRTSFCFEFDSQREHRQKSFVHPSSSSFSALLVYGSFVGRILFLPQVFLCSTLDMVSRCLCSPRLVFILCAGRSASPATRGRCPFCFVGQACRLICPSVDIATVSARPAFACRSLRSFCSVSLRVQVPLKASDRALVTIFWLDRFFVLDPPKFDFPARA